MSYAYEIETDDDNEFVFTRKDIASEDDAETLEEWADGLADREDILSMQIAAFHMNPRTDKESLLWLNRVCMAKAATSIGVSRVRQRRVALGYVPNHLDAQIKALEAKLSVAKAEILHLSEQLARQMK